MNKLSCLLLLLPFAASAQSVLPNPAITPGVINPAITQNNIKTTICVSGWTKTVRPVNKYTTALKKQQIEQYGFTDKDLTHYEEDHLISLEIGGHPSDPKNLWPQHYAATCGAKQKDRLENELHRRVCSGKMTLQDAQKAISKDWVDAFKLYIDGGGCG